MIVLGYDLAKVLSREIKRSRGYIDLKLRRRLDGNATEVPTKYRNNNSSEHKFHILENARDSVIRCLRYSVENQELLLREITHLKK